MTHAQILAFGLLGGAILMFAWGRFRYDLVALIALLIGIVTGDVSPEHAFTGFTGDVVIVIASALVVSAAIGRSGIIEAAISPLIARLRKPRSQVPVLAGATAILSMLTKNVGALAILMPVAIRLARKTGTPVSTLLMPMSFLSLLGGLVTLVGTSTNIIISQVREDTLGKPFNMFDFAPVGLILTAVGLLFVSFGWRLLPHDRKGRSALGDAGAAAAYSTEARVPETLPENCVSIADLKLTDDGVAVRAVIDADGHRRNVLPDAKLEPGTSLVLEGDDEALDRFYARGLLQPARDDEQLEKGEPAEEVRSIEAVVQTHSLMIGSSAEELRLKDRYGVQLLGIGRADARIVERLRDVRIRAGDMLIVRAGERTLPEMMATLGLLPLAERTVRLGDRRRRFLPALILAVAMTLVATKIAPVAPAFFGAAVMMIAVGAVSTREAYAALEPEVLVLIGALTPLSEAVQHSGGTALIAHALSAVLADMPAMLALGAIMLTAMAISPFLHNAPTVLVLGPIAVGVAQALGLRPEPFLMAIAVGSGCDFLTPIGHQCNTLIMGPGGYRFGDYARLGLPLSVLVLAIGTPLIAWVWPMA